MNAQLNGKSGLSVRFSRIFLLSSLENGEIKVHDLDRRAAYRTESALWASACIRRVRSAGLSLICSISNVRSTPNCFAASILPPGIGFRRRSIARASAEPVNCRNSITLVV
jgi:hypothetical protein